MEYRPFAPNVEVLGHVLQALLEGTGGRIAEAFARHGITDVQPDNWYSQKLMFQALKDFGQTSDLVSVGMEIIRHAVFPPEIDSVESALHAIDVAYHMNHRNGEIGYYRAEMQGPRHIVIECKNPYPCSFDYGLVYGVAQRFLPADGNLVVEHAQGECRKDGEDVCVYHVRW